MKYTLIAIALILQGCSLMRYSHTSTDGGSRSFWALALGSTTAIEDAQWKIGDSDLRIGKTGQQQQGIGEIIGQAAGTALKYAK